MTTSEIKERAEALLILSQSARNMVGSATASKEISSAIATLTELLKEELTKSHCIKPDQGHHKHLLIADLTCKPNGPGGKCVVTIPAETKAAITQSNLDENTFIDVLDVLVNHYMEVNGYHFSARLTLSFSPFPPPSANKEDLVEIPREVFKQIAAFYDKHGSEQSTNQPKPDHNDHTLL